MANKSVEIVAFDLDGTLLNDQKNVSDIDWQTLRQLKEKEILRVIATGRNYHSLIKLLPPDFPADYAIFSSGAGIIDLNSKKILYTKHLDEFEIKMVTDHLMETELNFSIHMPIPNNHHLILYATNPMAEDLLNYASIYKEFITPYNPKNLPKQATQLIVLLNNNRMAYHELQSRIPSVKTILTTSPINHTSLWAEIFHKSVSKANGLAWICNHLGINDPCIMGIGNDYNDIDLLNHTQYSFVVENAPLSLKEKYKVVKSNNESGFTEAINSIIKFN